MEGLRKQTLRQRRMTTINLATDAWATPLSIGLGVRRAN